MDNDFYVWASKKEKLHSKDTIPPFIREKEIWWCSVGKNVGFETNGKGSDFCRPVLVLKKMSKHTFIGIPLTTKLKQGSWYVKFQYKNKAIVANLSQMRMFDCKRLLTRVGEIRGAEYVCIKTGIKQLLDM